MPKSTRDSWNRFSFTALESNRSYWCLDFTFSAFRIVRQYKFLLFKPPYLWCLVFASPGYEYSCVCVCVCVCVCTRTLNHFWLFDSLQSHGQWRTRLFCPWDFPGKNYWSGLPFPTPGELPDPAIKPGSSALQVDSLPTEPPGNTVLLWIMDVRGWNWRQKKQFWEKLIPKLIGLI